MPDLCPLPFLRFVANVETGDIFGVFFEPGNYSFSVLAVDRGGCVVVLRGGYTRVVLGGSPRVVLG